MNLKKTVKKIGSEYKELNKDPQFRAEMLYAKIYAIVVTIIILLVLGSLGLMEIKF